MGYQIVPFLTTFSDLQDQLPFTRLFECGFFGYAAFRKISSVACCAVPVDSRASA